MNKECEQKGSGTVAEMARCDITQSQEQKNNWSEVLLTFNVIMHRKYGRK